MINVAAPFYFLLLYVSLLIPAGNEPSGHTCMHIFPQLQDMNL